MNIVAKLKLALSNSGLNDDEIAFYLNVLKHPGSSIYDIAQRADLPKDRAYKICESLEEKRLLSNDPASRKQKRLIANPLDSFAESLYSLGRKFYHTADSLKEVKPFLKYLNLTEKDEAAIETFSAEQMTENWLDLAYMNWETVLAYGNFEMMYENMGADPDQLFMRRRVKRGKKAFPILSHLGPYTREVVLKRDKKELRHSKILKTNSLKDTWITLFPDKDTVSIWLRDQHGIIKGATIKNPLLTKLHEDLFHHFDEIAEEQYDSKNLDSSIS